MAEQPNPIPLVTRVDPAAHSGDVVAENIEAIKALFPTIVTDGKIDFDVLRQLLGDAVDDGSERYGLNWRGKAKARAFALTPSLGTLRPVEAGSVDWNTTKNIVIEGDNLEVLKLLRKSYAGKVKLIYIDPPYNTGNDFVYPDNYTESLVSYEMLTGQRSGDGGRLTTNKEASGRFHTAWLNMIYPRLILAKELLAEDGIIAVSLNDGELPTLRSCMNEIFGEQNFIASLVWKSRQNKDNRSVNGASVDHEYVVCFGLRLRGDERVEGQYSNSDDDSRGPWTSANMVGLATPDRRPNLHYDLIDPATRHNYGCPPLGWRYEPATMTRLIAEGVILWPKEPGGRPRRKAYLADVGSEYTGYSSVVGKDKFTRDGTSDISNLFDVRVFDFPKPVALMQEIIVQGGSTDGLFVDFFAGSGTTGHAVMAQNALDGGKRRFILVQLPEPLDPGKPEQKTAADFCVKLGKPSNIAELTKERLRRAGVKVKADNPKAKVDKGFRVYKLATSNLKPWQPGEDIKADLLDATSNVLPGRSEDDLLVELLLKTGIDLALPSESRTIVGHTVHVFGSGTLVVCLSDIPASEAHALADGIADWLTEITPPDKTTFFFKDSGFDAGGSRAAEARANLAATLRQRLGDETIEKLGAI